MPKPAGAVIRKLRISHGDKVGDLARVCRIRPTSLTNIECCLKQASLEVLNRIANNYGVEVETLIAPGPQVGQPSADITSRSGAST